MMVYVVPEPGDGPIALPWDAVKAGKTVDGLPIIKTAYPERVRRVKVNGSQEDR